MGFVPAYSAPTQPDGGQVKTQEDQAKEYNMDGEGCIGTGFNDQEMRNGFVRKVFGILAL